MGKFKNKKNKSKKEVVNVVAVKTRKDIRKEKRNMKKSKKKEYFNKSKKHGSTDEEIGKFVKLPKNELEDVEDSKKEKKNKITSENIMLEETKGANKREEKLKDEMKKQRSNQLLKANQEEDKVIKKLEKQLKLKKRKSGNIAKSFASDGLGYLLEVCDERTMAAAVAAEKHLADTGSGSDFEEDMAIATGQTKLKHSKTKNKKGVISSELMENDCDSAGDGDSDSDDYSDDEENSDDDMYSDDDSFDTVQTEKKISKKQTSTKDNTVQSKSVLQREKICSPKNKIGIDEIKKKKRELMETNSSGESDNENDNESDNESSLNDESDFGLGEDSMDDEELSDDGDGNDFSEEELEMIYKGMSSFPDGIFRPGNLTPIMEDNENGSNSECNDNESSDKDNNKFCKSSQPSISFPDSPDRGSLSEEDETFSRDDEMSSSDNGIISDEDSENGEHAMHCDEEECDNSDCFNSSDEDCHHRSANKQIIVNGKVINSYGNDVTAHVEPELVRCPILDKYLENLSDSDTEYKPHTKDAVCGSVKSEHNKTDKTNSNVIKRKIDSDLNSNRPNKKGKIIDDSKTTKVAAKDKKVVENQKSKVSPKLKSKLDKTKGAKPEQDTDDSLSDDEEMDYDSEMLSDKAEEEINDESQGSWEDIYGRKRDKEGNIVTSEAQKYVPPHLRNQGNAEDSKEIMQLKRQIKGLLNKVAQSNMHWTSTQLEKLYSSNSRNAVNNAFCSQWMSSIVQPTTTADRMAIEHTMLIAILHANVGSEIGAHFLQTAVKRFDEMISVEQKLANKELDNLILSISQFYNFKIFQGSLLYEILGKLVEKMSEKNIECILVALRNVGAVLRKEDPAALKVFIHTTQEMAVDFKDTSSDGSRVKFLLDVLMAIKNNNMSKIPNYDPSYSEEMKKALKGIIRKGNYVVQLNINLDDLLNADERGRWWVVGSAWEGNVKPEKISEASGSNKQNDVAQSNLLELARSQRINTDLRRNIFCVIMSAEDYMDAFEKLLLLGLKNQQEREIIHVLISCCLQEKTYNPYYSILAQKFCDYDRKFQMFIQYAIWDKLKELDTISAFQIASLAQFLTHLFIEKGLPISILKVVQFSDLNKPTLRLMRQILLAILLHKSPQTCLEVFQRVSVSPKLHLFREGLKLFINHFLIKHSEKKENLLNNEQTILLKERASFVEKTLQSDSKIQF